MITLWGELYMLGELRQIWGSCYNMDASSNFNSFNKEQKDFLSTRINQQCSSDFVTMPLQVCLQKKKKRKGRKKEKKKAMLDVLI